MDSISIFRKLPKIELHAHLNGCLTLKSIEKLINMTGDASLKAPTLLSAPSTMEEVFKLFPVVQAVTSTYSTVRQATIDVITEFAEENTRYLELRTTPKAKVYFGKTQYVEAVLDGIRACTDLRIVVRLLLSIDKRQTIEEAEEIINLVLNDKTGMIVGLDLSGDPSVDGRKFLPLLRKAKAAGIKSSIHLAEIETQLDEVDDFLEFGPDRIGHGTFLHKERKWIDKIVGSRIPIEICLTSNIMTKTVTSLSSSHFAFWYAKGLPVAICTDDSGLMGTTLSNEYALAAEKFNPDLKQILNHSLEMSFLDKTSKEYQLLHKEINSCL